MKSAELLLCGLISLMILSAVDIPAVAQDAGEDEIQMISSWIQGEDADFRALGFGEVRDRAKGEAATKHFASLLPKLSPDAQVGLLSALGERGDTLARPDVLSVLGATDSDAVKAAAIKAIGYLGQQDDLPLLVAMLAEGSDDGKAAAQRSLVRISGEEIHPTIVQLMRQSEPKVQVTLIEILTTRRAVDIIPDLIATACGDNAVTRAAAMTSLGQIADAQQLPGMVQGVLAAEQGAEREAAEKCVMFVCNRIEDKEKQADPLLRAVAALPHERDRTAMLPTIGRVGGIEARKLVEAAINSRDTVTHEMGVRALCNWPDSSIATLLMQLTRGDLHPDHRKRALRALIRVAPLGDEKTEIEKLKLLWGAMALSQRDEERNLVLERAPAIRIPESLRFVLPYLDYPPCMEQACLSVVDLAHHRGLREPNKDMFHPALDKVMSLSKDRITVARARRYKEGGTWLGSDE